MRSCSPVFVCCFALLACDKPGPSPAGNATQPSASASSAPSAAASASAKPTSPAASGSALAAAGKPLEGIVEVGCGQAHTCARTSGGDAYCWGRNHEKQLGGFEGERSASPVKVAGLGKVAQLAVGASHACALASDASVTCWGGGLPMHRIEGLKAVASIGAGGSQTCALTGSGKIYCWQREGTPQAAPVEGDVLVVGPREGCAFKHDATALQCWPPPQAARAPRTKSFPEKILWASGDFEKGCAGLANGKTYCWGLSTAGELGTPAADAGVDVPFNAFEDPVSSVVFGPAYACSIVQGAPMCRGSNESGELGRGLKDRTKHPELIRVGGLDKVTMLAAGGAHACAVLTNKTLACWGLGDQGQVGNGTIGEVPTASLVVVGK